MSFDCKRCGAETDMKATMLCDSCWELSRRIQEKPAIALQILDDLGELPVPLPILNIGTANLLEDTGKLDETMSFYSMLLPEGEVTLSLPRQRLSQQSFDLLDKWFELVGKAILWHREATSEVSGQDET